ncbi:MAG: alpha/beta fold hydrolase [Planctomycetota bacterium]
MVACLKPYRRMSTGYVQLRDGYTAEYIDAGEGEPVVLVPGLAGGLALLEPLIQELSGHFRVLAYQLRGEERGLFERRFGFRQLVQDLDEVICQFALERPGLIGASFGGAIALDFATRNSHRLSFLAVQGSSYRYAPGLFGDVARRVLDRLPLPFDNPFVNQFFSVLIGGRRKEGDRFDFIVDRCWQTDQSVMAQRFAMLEEYDIRDQVRSLRVPTLVLNGERDIMVPTREAKSFADQVPHGRYEEIAAAGHLAFVTHVPELSRRIQVFGQSSLSV